MENTNNIIIIGGGASGLMCALTACLKGKSVTILESGFKLGKKILASGNGRCNLTNKNILKNCYNFFPNQLNQFNNLETLKFFSDLGLETYFDDEGRCYPVSNHSASVLEVLLNKLKTLKCNIVTNCLVSGVIKTQNGFNVETSLGLFNAEKVVVATGGNTMKTMLNSFGVEVKDFTPSLCGLKTQESTKLISGIRQTVKLHLTAKNFSEVEQGEIIFREDGVSGICAFNLSSKLNWSNVSKANLTINLLPEMSEQEVFNLLSNRKQKLTHLKALNFFDGLFVNNLGQELLNRNKISLSADVKKLTEQNLKGLANTISNFNLTIVGKMDNNQVHHGGVELNELTECLQLKKVKNMFCCGEVVNVDGVCGGYNLQWAWTSGHIVGDSLWLK